MSSYGKIGRPGDSHSESEELIVETCGRSNLFEVEALIKFAIWSGFSRHGKLMEIQVSSRCAGNSRYELKLTFAVSGQRDHTDFLSKYSAQRQEEFEKYKLGPTLIKNQGYAVQMEVREASHGILPILNVTKLLRCSSFENLNKIIQEALIQVRLNSAYTCKLQDFFIRKGSNCAFEAGLVMERLEGDLKADIKRHSQQDIHYSEFELRRILKCMAEALLFAKLRVKFT